MKTQTIPRKMYTMLALAGALSVWASNPTQAGMFCFDRNSPAGIDVAQYRQRIGPFATWTRANEVANYYRQMGYSTTQAFHSGDGYTLTSLLTTTTGNRCRVFPTWHRPDPHD